MHDRIFTKKTRRGQILKIVREHYLRDDLSCGAESCSAAGCLIAQQQLLSQSKLLLESSANTETKHANNKSTCLIICFLF